MVIVYKAVSHDRGGHLICLGTQSSSTACPWPQRRTERRLWIRRGKFSLLEGKSRKFIPSWYYPLFCNSLWICTIEHIICKETIGTWKEIYSLRHQYKSPNKCLIMLIACLLGSEAHSRAKWLPLRIEAEYRIYQKVITTKLKRRKHLLEEGCSAQVELLFSSRKALP